jgi:hypothetical protein
MKRLLIAAALLAAFTACRDVPTAPERSPSRGAAPLGAAQQDAGDYIVVLSPSTSSVDDRAQELATLHGGQIQRTYHFALKGFVGRFSPAAAAALRAHSDVTLVEADGEMRLIATQQNATWGLDRIDQRALPLSGTYTYTPTGAGTNVYIIDTGIRLTHTEFAGRAFSAFTAVNDGNGTDDCNGHGTHVSGTVAGSTYGVAKSARLYAVRVLPCGGSGPTSAVIAGVDWVTGNHGSPAVANMSLGGGISDALDQAVTNSIASGVTYAIAAGNDNVDACTSSPARVSAALTVGSTTTTDARSSFSNVGTCVDVFAPGSGITSAWFTSDGATNVLSGTSMASPHVAGAAALYLETNPGASPATVAQALLGNATSGALTGVGTGSPNLLLYTGFLNSGPANQAPVARFTVSCTGLTCTFDGRSSSDDVGVVSYAWDLGKFPDGTASGPVVTTTYPHDGQRTVTLTVTDGGALTNSTSQTFSVSSPPAQNQPPTARFTVSCNGLTCTLDGRSSSDDVGVTSYAWDLGKSPDGTATGPVVTVTYPHDGERTVTLVVTDGGGLTGSTTQTFSVGGAPPPQNQPPVADFSVSCDASHFCTLDGRLSTDDKGVVSYDWQLDKFPDPTATGPVVTTDYFHAGSRTVTLTVRDAEGLVATVTKTFQVP